MRSPEELKEAAELLRCLSTVRRADDREWAETLGAMAVAVDWAAGGTHPVFDYLLEDTRATARAGAAIVAGMEREEKRGGF